MNLNLMLDNHDLGIIAEISRCGTANLVEISFGTGHFQGDVSYRLAKLIDMRCVVEIAGATEPTYCITARGLEAIYLADAFLLGAFVSYRHKLVNPAKIKLKQRHVLKIVNV